MNTAPSSSIMEIAAAKIAMLFVVANFSINAVTDHTCSVDYTI